MSGAAVLATTLYCANKQNNQTEQPMRCRKAVQLSAARGKLCDSSPRAQLGCLTNVTVPQRWFLHFYVAGSVCNTCLLYCLLTSWPHCDTCSPQKQVCSSMQLVASPLAQTGDVTQRLSTRQSQMHPGNQPCKPCAA